MLTGLLKQFKRNLPSAAQAYPPAALNDDEVDGALRDIRLIEGSLASLKVKLAGARAVRRGHGDGGASTLKELSGMSTWQARQSVATAKTLGQMRAVQGAAEDGQISADNAARLARAARKTSPQAVESDHGLLAAAQKCAADDFDTTVSRWEQARQRDGGMGEHLTNRRKRYLRFWTKHGMVYFKGRTDLITGTAIRRRLEQLAQQLRKQDTKTDPKPGNGATPQPGRLTFKQAMADALNTATSPNPTHTNITNPDHETPPNPNLNRNPKPDRNLNPATDLAHNPNTRTNQTSASRSSRRSGLGGQSSAGSVDPTGELSDQSSPSTTNRKHDLGDQDSASRTSRRKESGNQNPPNRTNCKVGLSGQGSANSVDLTGELSDQYSANDSNRRSGYDNQNSANRASRKSVSDGQSPASGAIHRDGINWGGRDSGSGMPKAEIIVVMDLPALLGDNKARCEIPTIGPIPAPIAQQLAAIHGVIPILLDGNGEPLRHSGQKRLATREQWQALIARDNACIGCGADPLRCEAHHDPPFSQTGRTWIEELVLLCYECHHKVHDQKWQIVLKNGKRTLQPPNTQPANPRNQSELTNHPKPVTAPTPKPHTHHQPLLC